MIYRSLITVSCVILLLLAVTGANGLYVLELVQVAHRHGVTPPPPTTPNRDKMCSPAGTGSCNAIANRGVQQMAAVGKYIQRLYGADAATTGSATWFQSPYDASTVHSRSVAETATAQAAAAVLRGAYAAEAASLVPVVIAAPLERDTLLNVNALSSVTVTKDVNAAALRKKLEAVVDKQFPDANVLSTMGAEVGLGAVCAAPATRVSCCHELQKLAVMYAVMGTGDEAPTVTANKAKLDAVAAAEFDELFGYSASEPVDAGRGSLGQPLVQEMLQNMRAKMLPKSDAQYNANTIMQYAHNVPLRTTLGHTATAEAPVGETFLVDLLRDDATHAYFVRLRYVTAANDASTATPAVFPFRCLSAANVPTDATTADGIICPFDDFARFVDTTKGTSPAGAACYLDDATMKEFGCNVEGPAPSQACAKYRTACSSQACPAGQVYDVTDGFCKQQVVLGNVMSTSAGVGVAVACVFCGFLLSVFLLHFLPMLLSRGKATSVQSRFLSDTGDGVLSVHDDEEKNMTLGGRNDNGEDNAVENGDAWTER